VRETGRPIAQIARELGINSGTLGNWVAKDQAERDGGAGLSADDAAELKRLRGEVAELRMERDVQALRGPVGEGGDEVSVARFIADQRTKYRVPHTISCVIVGLSPSWFYKWIKAPVTVRGRRRAELDAKIRELFEASDRTYGSPQIHRDLLEAGWQVLGIVGIGRAVSILGRCGCQSRPATARRGPVEWHVNGTP
jgi:hypothetical protein